jgi:Tfp pilus assembly protein PilV
MGERMGRSAPQWRPDRALARLAASGRRSIDRLSAERGASLVEFLVAVGIGAFLVPTALATVLLIYQTNSEARDRLAVAQDVQNIVRWLRTDLTPGATGNNRGRYAGQSITVADDALTIERVDLTSGQPVTSSITYQLSGRQLTRTSSEPAASSVIAQHLTSLSFSRFDSGIGVAMTSQAGKQSLSLTTQITPRSQ